MHMELFDFHWQRNRNSLNFSRMLASLGKLNKVKFPSFTRGEKKKTLLKLSERRAYIVNSEAEHSGVRACQRQSGLGGDSAVHRTGGGEYEARSRENRLCWHGCDGDARVVFSQEGEVWGFFLFVPWFFSSTFRVDLNKSKSVADSTYHSHP